MSQHGIRHNMTLVQDVDGHPYTHVRFNPVEQSAFYTLRTREDLEYVKNYNKTALWSVKQKPYNIWGDPCCESALLAGIGQNEMKIEPNCNRCPYYGEIARELNAWCMDYTSINQALA